MQMGKFRKVRQKLEALIEEDQRYLGFAQPLIALTKQFNSDEIDAILHQHLSSEDAHV